MPKLVVTRGLPASGKSTWAKEMVRKYGWKRVNRDEIRAMADDSQWSQRREKTVRKVEQTLAELFLSQGHNVVVDDTNLVPSTMFSWQQFAQEHGAEFEVKDFTGVPLDECLKRNEGRPNRVDSSVIRGMYRQYLADFVQPPVIVEGAPWVTLCDLDGTLALLNGRDPYDASTCEQDKVNQTVRSVLNAMIRDGASSLTILLSGRSDEYRSQTQRWLNDHGIYHSMLLMRSTGDNRRDAIVKRELYEAHIQGVYNVRLVLDDRNQVVDLWRSLGLPCFQVNYGDF